MSTKKKNKHNTSPEKEEEITKREKEVLILLSDGFKYREIAEKLFISPSTVTKHRKNLIKKLKARNTAHLVKLAMLKKII